MSEFSRSLLRDRASTCARSQGGRGVIVDTPSFPVPSSFRLPLESSLIVSRVPVCPPASPSPPPSLFRRAHMVFREMNGEAEGRAELFRYSTPPAPEISSAPRRGEMPYVINRHSTSAFDPVTPGAPCAPRERSSLVTLLRVQFSLSLSLSPLPVSPPARDSSSRSEVAISMSRAISRYDPGGDARARRGTRRRWDYA